MEERMMKRFQIVMAVLVLIVFSFAAFAQEDAVVGHWALDEGVGTKVMDGTGNYPDGSFEHGKTGGGKNPVWVSPGIDGGSALYLSKMDSSFVMVPPSPDSVMSNQKGSMSLWFYRASDDTVGIPKPTRGMMVYQGNFDTAEENGVPDGWGQNWGDNVMRLRDKDGLPQPQWAFRGMCGEINLGNFPTWRGPHLENCGTGERQVWGANEAAGVSQDMWHHLVGTWDANPAVAAIDFYIDGVWIEGGDYAPLSDFVWDVAVIFGRGGNGNMTGSARHFQGTIDQVKFFNYALTEEQVVAEYDMYKDNANTAPTLPEPLPEGLVGYWPLDEGMGEEVMDMAGNYPAGTFEHGKIGGGSDPLWVSPGIDGGSALYLSKMDSSFVMVPPSPDSVMSNQKGSMSLWFYRASDDTVGIPKPTRGMMVYQGNFDTAEENGVPDGWGQNWGDNVMRLRDKDGLPQPQWAFRGMCGEINLGNFPTWRGPHLENCGTGERQVWGANEAAGVSQDMWHHLVGTWDANPAVAAIDFYIDGVWIEGGDYAPLSDFVWDVAVIFGRGGNGNMTGSARHFQGTIDQVKFFDYALTEEQVVAEYDMYKDNVGNAPVVTAGERQPVAQQPDKVILLQNYPNPFNPTTNIEFTLSNPGHIKLSVFNMLGQEVITLVDGDQSAGLYRAVWDAKDNRGVVQNSGVYFARLETEHGVFVTKMLLVK